MSHSDVQISATMNKKVYFRSYQLIQVENKIKLTTHCVYANVLIFVSPELSSVRDYVITHSVRSM